VCLVRSWGHPFQALGDEIKHSIIRLARNLDGECIKGVDTTRINRQFCGISGSNPPHMHKEGVIQEWVEASHCKEGGRQIA
jgi:hypothetical protein